LTAASIAKKIGIFTEKTSVEIMEEEGISYEEAIDKADAIVINGEMLTKAAKEDEGLPEQEQGKILEKWLMKP
jgi:magnesium-transporting ATPase (P-type)